LVLAGAAFCVSVATAAPVRADDATESAAALGPGLQFVDWLLICVYGISTIGLGAYFGRKQQNLKEYFVGSGTMNPILIGVSLFATLLSTISYLSAPGEVLGKGPIHLTVVLGYPLVWLVGAFWLLPVYMKNRVTSAYELLEVRLGVGVRILGALMFLALRLVWMSLLVYLTANAMSIMMGLSKDWIPIIVLVTGLVAVIYTSLGGLRAVVITDLMQTILLFGGAVLVILLVTIDRGFSWIPTEWNSNWDTQPLLPESLSTRVSLLGSFVSFFIWYVCTAGGDQTSVQRFMSTEDARAARIAFAVQLAVSTVVMLTLGAVGFALLDYFTVYSEQLPDHIDIKKNADAVFPHFIAYKLPIGVSGLVVSAMFAAAMSSIDSGVNSITAVVMSDFLGRFGFHLKSKIAEVWVARIMAFAIGLIVVFGSTFMGAIPGNITAVTGKTSNLLTTPIFALFIFALFIPRSRAIGVFVGAFFGVLVAVMIAFSGPLATHLILVRDFTPEFFGIADVVVADVDGARVLMTIAGEQLDVAPDPISFQWIGPFALAVNIFFGVTANAIANAVLGPPPERPVTQRDGKPSHDD
jgi:SSS family solute:Na+ symporter